MMGLLHLKSTNCIVSTDPKYADRQASCMGEFADAFDAH